MMNMVLVKNLDAKAVTKDLVTLGFWKGIGKSVMFQKIKSAQSVGSSTKIQIDLLTTWTKLTKGPQR